MISCRSEERRVFRFGPHPLFVTRNQHRQFEPRGKTIKKLLVLSPPLLILLMLSACSLATTLHFDEFGTSPLLNVDGVHVFGVTFQFSLGGGRLQRTDWNVGVRRAGFRPALHRANHRDAYACIRSPTPLLQFDLALHTLATIDPAYTVTLSSGLVLSGLTTPQLPDGLYSEGTFFYTGAPVTGATITFYSGVDPFNDSANVSAFGLHNLTAQPPDPATPLLLFGALLARRDPKTQDPWLIRRLNQYR